jgi:kynureninase
MSPTVSADPLLAHRAEFPILDHTLHFISHSLGAMPRGVYESLARYARQWDERGIRAWEEGWLATAAELGDLLAPLIGAEPGSISMHPNVTLAQAVALSAVEWKAPRNRLVCTEEDFPSVLYLYEGLKRQGAEVVRVKAGPGRRVAESDVVAAIDERTAVVAISCVLFRTAERLDLAPICRRAREAGAISLVDAYQAVGAAPLDVQALGVDLLAGGSVKWLCGGPGAGYLYCRPALAERLRPALTGWMAHEQPFAFDPGPMRYARGAWRFLTGTPAVPALFAARPGYEIVSRIGITAIREKSLRQTGRMIALADEYGFRVVSPREAERRGGTVVLDVPNAEAVCRAAARRDFLFDFRPGVGLRLAPHFYTRDDEVEEAMSLLRRLVEEAGRSA